MQPRWQVTEQCKHTSVGKYRQKWTEAMLFPLQRVIFVPKGYTLQSVPLVGIHLPRLNLSAHSRLSELETFTHFSGVATSSRFSPLTYRSTHIPDRQALNGLLQSSRFCTSRPPSADYQAPQEFHQKACILPNSMLASSEYKNVDRSQVARQSCFHRSVLSPNHCVIYRIIFHGNFAQPCALRPSMYT